MNVSDGFKSLILGPHAFVDIFAGGTMVIYANNQPASPELSDSAATEIGRVTAFGLPWNFGSSANGLQFYQDGPYILNYSLPPWVCIPTASQTAAWFRLYSADPTETRGNSSVLPRIDGTIGLPGTATAYDMYMDDPVFIAGTSKDFTYFLYTILPITGS